MPKQAVVLAAGGGGRIRPFTANRPKSMLFIADKPMVQHVIEALGRNGIRNIILVVGHHKERIFDFLGSGEAMGADITYVAQEQQLGSADALKAAQKYAEAEFLVVPGNKYLRAETLFPIVNADVPSMLIKRAADPMRTSIVSVNNGIIEKCLLPERRAASTPREKGIYTIDTRVYGLNRDIFPFLEGAPSICAALSRMISAGSRIAAVETDGEWSDLIYPWDILSVNGSVLNHIEANTSGVVEPYVSIRGKVNIGSGGTIHAGSIVSGPLVIGSGCKLGPYTQVSGPVSIGANTIVESFACISNSVIGSNVHISPGAIIQDSIIDDSTFIGPRFTTVSSETDIRVGQEYHRQKMGAMIGEGCQLGAGIITQPGTIVGNFCQAQDLKVLSGDIPDRSRVV